MASIQKSIDGCVLFDSQKCGTDWVEPEDYIKFRASAQICGHLYKRLYAKFWGIFAHNASSNSLHRFQLGHATLCNHCTPKKRPDHNTLPSRVLGVRQNNNLSLSQLNSNNSVSYFNSNCNATTKNEIIKFLQWL